MEPVTIFGLDPIGVGVALTAGLIVGFIFLGYQLSRLEDRVKRLEKALQERTGEVIKV